MPLSGVLPWLFLNLVLGGRSIWNTIFRGESFFCIIGKSKKDCLNFWIFQPYLTDLGGSVEISGWKKIQCLKNGQSPGTLLSKGEFSNRYKNRTNRRRHLGPSFVDVSGHPPCHGTKYQKSRGGTGWLYGRKTPSTKVFRGRYVDWFDFRSHLKIALCTLTPTKLCHLF